MAHKRPVIASALRRSGVAVVVFLFVSVALLSCGSDGSQESLDALLGRSVDLDFMSDVSWLQDDFGSLEQASMSWVWGGVIFMQEIAGVKDVPVVFDADNPPKVRVHLIIQAAGSELLGNRGPVTIFEQEDYLLTLIRLSTYFNIGGNTIQVEKIPENIPEVGGKTIFPMYFAISIDQFAWSLEQTNQKAAFVSGFRQGDLSEAILAGDASTPVPWVDCETVKITVRYQGQETEDNRFQLEAVKYLAADARTSLKFLNLLKEGKTVDNVGLTVPAQTQQISDALASLDSSGCPAIDKNQAAKLFE